MQHYKIAEEGLVFDIESLNSWEAKPYIFKVRDLPNTEKPREKLIKNGPESLATAELLAVIFGTGTKKEEVLQMSSRILKEYGEQTLMHRNDPQQISDDLNIPLNKAVQIVACGELGRRFYQKKGGGLAVVRTPKDVFNYCQDMRDLPKEQLRGIYLNSHHRVIHDEVVSIGTINSSIVHPREVFKPAIQYGAVAVVLVHNHPSGILKPSATDVEVTRQLIEAGKLIGISLIDHIIITKSGFVSIEASYE